ncbi:MAG: TetR/AcrR family transcriptional regulator [Syntrophothermus sp.]
MEDNEKILNAATERFMKDGFYKTSMDELARSLSMSKKTIYKYFPSKEVLVEKIIEAIMTKVSSSMDELLEGPGTSIEKITGMLTILSTIAMNQGDRWPVEIQRHAPHLWQKIERFRRERITKNITIIVEQGKHEGLFRDKSVDFIMPIFLAAINAVITPDFLMNHNYSFGETVTNTFDILLNGILTENGHKQFINIKNRKDK